MLRRLEAVIAIGALFGLVGRARTEPVAVVSPTSIPTATPTPTPTRTPIPTPTRRSTPGRPAPTDWSNLTDPVLHHKLYSAGKVPAVRCALPQPNLTSKAAMVAYAKVLVGCMDKAWAPVVEKSDAVLTPPEVFAYSSKRPAATPECSDPPTTSGAFYHWSGLTGKICFAVERYLGADDPVANTIDFQRMIAHEYGHHVQRSVGILTLYTELMHGKSETGQLEVLRRKELQASCLGAAFLGANKAAFRLSGERLEIWRYIVQHVGDEYGEVRDHGSRKNHGYWSIRAFDSANPASCNTFTAPAKRVS